MANAIVEYIGGKEYSFPPFCLRLSRKMRNFAA